MDDDKIQSIRDYLSKHFPNCTLEDKEDFSRGAQTFRIKTEKGILLAIFSEEFIEDNDSISIINKIDKWNITDQLRNNSSAIVIVTNHGIRYESKHWDKIEKSLEDKRYKWRTTRGVVKENKLPLEEVEKAFNWHSDRLIKSSIPSDSGEALYTTREHYRRFQSPFTKIISSVFTSVSSSASSGGEDG
jgi:hypothetical protein